MKEFYCWHFEVRIDGCYLEGIGVEFHSETLWRKKKLNERKLQGQVRSMGWKIG